MGITVPFPDVLPAGYEWFNDEPTFNPERHLDLEEPGNIVMLSDLGYGEEEIVNKATPVAASTPFRMLSHEGVQIMLSVAKRLRAFAHPAGDRIERMTRSGCYRSRWLRDLCISPEVTDHLSSIYGVEVAPHAMPVHLGHVNYEPSKINTAIDKWHHDTIALDYVLMVTDPRAVPGGRFEYFVGTKQEAAELARHGKTPSKERVAAPDFRAAGYAIALHGDMVVHRAAPLTELVERITMVNGYTATDPSLDDQSRPVDLIPVDDHECLWTEWAKFAAWRSHGRLTRLLEELEFTSDPEAVAGRLETAIADVRGAIAEMRGGERQMLHYGG
ncbi:MAG: hypothetical protein ACR2RL_00420 [Gammaproteobacteria bacterium]